MSFNLDKSQLKAVESNDNNILLCACPGSGKTTVGRQLARRLRDLAERLLHPGERLLRMAEQHARPATGLLAARGLVVVGGLEHVALGQAGRLGGVRAGGQQFIDLKVAAARLGRARRI